ncbi:Hypothetical protein R9X50_00090800 [Acrodontium crateriforme]|uniref:Peptidase S54 rhomboid domain-containing protein n=1 Tax=Acrodontium crateriforme TaxID=150365 RepID=A0AAQ3R9K8_9PEZI|nr:Hypothetical protein R9X50_00090800 [Acrodontium crateriforme]
MLSRSRLSALGQFSTKQFGRIRAVPRRPTIQMNMNMNMNRIPRSGSGSGSAVRFFSERSGHWYYTQHRSTKYVANTVLVANAAVFFAWQYASIYQNRKLMQFLNENFILSWRAVKEGRIWTLLTSAFSHTNFAHFLFNCLAFNAFAGIISGIPGVGGIAVAGLALGSAVTGSLAFLAQNREKGRSSMRSALGASGMVCGFSAAATCLVPKAPMYIMFIPVAIPLWACTAVFLGIDLFYLDDDSSLVGHAAHLGGFGFGLAYYALGLSRFGGILRAGRRGF